MAVDFIDVHFGGGVIRSAEPRCIPRATASSRNRARYRSLAVEYRL